MGQVMAIFAASAKTTLAMWPIVERIIDAEDAKAEAKVKAEAKAKAEDARDQHAAAMEAAVFDALDGLVASIGREKTVACAQNLTMAINKHLERRRPGGSYR